MDAKDQECQESDARAGGLMLPEILAHERTPLVLALLSIIEQLDARIRVLENDNARLKGPKSRPRSNDKPSSLEKPVAGTATGKRAGSEKRSKTRDLKIDEEIVLRPEGLPPDSTLQSCSPWVVQDLRLESRTICYQMETWRTPTGALVRAPLPAGTRGHFGPGLIGFILQQHYQGKVTQPNLLEELRDLGIDISAGQIHNLLTGNQEAFHAEKDEVLAAGLRESRYVNVDDSGAPHQGQYGSCLAISNEFFTSFHSSDTKSRIKFLEVLRCTHTDYLLNDLAWSYLEEQGLPAKVLRQLQEHPQRVFADATAWQQHLATLAIAPSNRDTVTEAALLASAVEHGVSLQLGIVSDGAAQYALLVHGLCWIHQERNVAKLVPNGAEQKQALEEVLTALWQLYKDLKAYRASPSATAVPLLQARFDELVGRTTCFAELNAALARLQANKPALLRVLERPDLPLHNNTVETDFRDWATKRKVSAGTRSTVGRRCRDTFMSLKGTCRKLGIRFWAYLQDRLMQVGKIPRLAELVREKAAASATT